MNPSERILVLICLAAAFIGGGAFLLWPQSELQTSPHYAPPARTGELPELAIRDVPLQVKPTRNFAEEISDEALYYALDTSVPYSEKPTIAQLLHELRLWGSASPFPTLDDHVGRSGEWTRSVLLDNDKCEEHALFADTFDGFLVRTRYGTRVLTSSDPGLNTGYAQGHYGQLLQVLAEIGTPLSQAVTDDEGNVGDIRHLIQDSAARYSPNDEQEFMAIAFASWLEPETEWTDRFGKTHTMDEIARELVRMSPGQGTCYGGHVPMAITIVLRINETESIISDEMRRALEAHLKEFSRVLTRSQREDGAWDYDWAGTSATPGNMAPSSQEVDRITCTGHHLEWIALAPPELCPDDEVTRKAIAALSELLINMPPKSEQSFKDMLPASHAARALCLLRGEEPYDFWRHEYQQRNEGKVEIGPNRSPDDQPTSDSAEH